MNIITQGYGGTLVITQGYGPAPAILGCPIYLDDNPKEPLNLSSDC